MTTYNAIDKKQNFQASTLSSSLDMLSLLLRDSHKMFKKQSNDTSLDFSLSLINDGASCLKDLNGRYLFCNKQYIDLVCIDNVEYRGKTDVELSSIMMDFEKELSVQDKIVISDLKTIKTLNINDFNDSNKKTIIVFSKSPVFDKDNNLTGVSYIEEDVANYYDTCYKINKSLFGYKTNSLENLNISLLTNSESEVVYLLVCGYKLNEISNILEKSYSTVRGYQQSAINKFDLINTRDLIENCRLSYLPKLIPSRFLVKQSIII